MVARILTILSLVIIAAIFFRGNPLYAREVGLDVYGVSYHYKQKVYYIHTEHGYQKKRYNELNPGIGLQYTFYENGANSLSGGGGVYKDSMEHTAKYGGFGYKRLIAGGLSAGVYLIYFDTKSYTKHFAPLPNIAYRYKNAAVNLIWIPDPEVPALALSITLFIHKWE